MRRKTGKVKRKPAAAPPRASQVSPSGKLGPYETKAAALVVAARDLDAAIKAYRAAKPALERATENWRDALRRFNGKPTAADELPAALELPSPPKDEADVLSPEQESLRERLINRPD